MTSFKEMLKDLYTNSDNSRGVIVWADAWEDENGKIHYPFMEDFDKAMKEHVSNN